MTLPFGPHAVARAGWSLRLHPGQMTFARLDGGSPLPDWANDARPLSSVTWYEGQMSVLAPVEVVPDDVDRFGPWRAFEVEGGVDVLLTGVLHGIISPLAASHIAVTTECTYYTTWILVPENQAQSAVNIWRAHGYPVHVPDATAASA